MPQYDLLVFEIMLFTFGVLALSNIIKNWKQNKNRILIAISIYLISVLLRSTIDVVIYLFDINLDVKVIGYLTFGLILANLLLAIQLEFMFYLKKLTKFYSFPPIMAFYILAGRVLVDSGIVFIIYITIATFFSAYFLIKDGRNKRNGLAVGMGLFFIMWGVGQMIPIPIALEIFKIIGMIAMYLGTRGFYERYIFVNVQEEEKIISTWISKLVVKD
jgi:hypothetical protein